MISLYKDLVKCWIWPEPLSPHSSYGTDVHRFKFIFSSEINKNSRRPFWSLSGPTVYSWHERHIHTVAVQIWFLHECFWMVARPKSRLEPMTNSQFWMFLMMVAGVRLQHCSSSLSMLLFAPSALLLIKSFSKLSGACFQFVALALLLASTHSDVSVSVCPRFPRHPLGRRLCLSFAFGSVKWCLAFVSC